jgi:hypothetical protein
MKPCSSLSGVGIWGLNHRALGPESGAEEDLANGEEKFALSILVATAFVQIVTHLLFRPYPTPLVQTLSTIDALMEAPSCIPLGPGKKSLGSCAASLHDV